MITSNPIRRWGLWLLAALFVSGGGALLAGCESRGNQPDLILITFDTTRADRLGCYGSALAATPNIDRFAQQAILFENAFTPVPVTSPSHASMMTGLTPLRHGVRNNGSFVLGEDRLSLAERLRNHGYRTAAFVSAFVLNRQFGLSQGFETYDDELVDERRGAETTRRAIDWLQAVDDQPIFLWVHYFDPHTPWTPLEPFASDTRGTPYDAEISAMDASFGTLLDALRAEKRFDAAHIFVVGDHGEGLEDHGELEHGIFLYDECIHVPYLWKPAGRREGTRQSGLVGTVDLLPTMLELSGAPSPSPDEIDGVSLARLPEGGSIPPREGLYAETLFPYYNFEWSPSFAWRTSDHKFIEAPTEELYNLTTDPGERENRAAADPEIIHPLRKRLRNYRLRYGSESGLPRENALTPEVEERLRSLGYVWTAGHEEKAPFDSLPDPKDMIVFHAHYEAAKTAAERGHWQEAIDGLQIVVRETPHNVTALLGLGHVLVEAGRPKEALTWLQQCLAIRPRNAVALETLGDAYAQLSRWTDALKAYDQADWNQTAARALAKKRGMVLARLKRWDEARDSFRRGRAASPQAEHAPWDRWIEATTNLEQWGTERAASNPRDWSIQVKAAMRLEQPDRAEDLLGQGRHYDDRMYWGLRAEIALGRSDWPAAQTALRQVAAGDSVSQKLYLMLMLAHLNSGDLAGAGHAGREGAARVDDSGGSIHYNLACIEARLGNLEAGLEALAEAIESGYQNLEQIRNDSELDSLRASPRFAEIMSRARQQADKQDGLNRP